MKPVFIVIIALFVLLGGAPQFAYSQDVICAAVLPCNPDGTVMPEFNLGACAPLYQSQCLEDHLRNIKEDLNQVNSSLVRCEKRETTLKNTLTQNQKLIRSLRRALHAKRG